MKDIEIEIQVKIGSSATLRTFLEKNAKFVSENRQIDEYFTPAHEDFTKVRPIAEWFRIRDERGAFSVNYKNWHSDDKGIGQYADEFETTVGDKATMRKILLALDFKPLITVDKTRKKYLFEDYEIAFDTVVGLGDFVEIEYKGSKTVDPKATTDGMIAFLRGLDCGSIEVNNGGYPMLLLFPENAHFIKVA